jgi:hypothetical protein
VCAGELRPVVILSCGQTELSQPRSNIQVALWLNLLLSASARQITQAHVRTDILLLAIRSVEPKAAVHTRSHAARASQCSFAERCCDFVVPTSEDSANAVPLRAKAAKPLLRRILLISLDCAGLALGKNCLPAGGALAYLLVFRTGQNTYFISEIMLNPGPGIKCQWDCISLEVTSRVAL